MRNCASGKFEIPGSRFARPRNDEAKSPAIPPPPPTPCVARRANHAWSRSSPARKNIPLRDSPKSRIKLRHPVPHEGRIRIVRNAGRDAVDAAASAWTGIAGRALPVSDHPYADERRHSLAEPFGEDRFAAYGKTVWAWHPLLMSSWRR
jgi:hypothetical protein